MDNTEDVIKNNLENFEKLLSYLYDECPYLSIIVTSRKGMGYCKEKAAGPEIGSKNSGHDKIEAQKLGKTSSSKSKKNKTNFELTGTRLESTIQVLDQL